MGYAVAMQSPADDGGATPFPVCWAQVAPALHTWARLRVRPGLAARIDPEDLVQEVCCRAYQGFAGYDAARGPFRGWVFGIANHVLRAALIDLQRAPRSRPPALDEASCFLDRVPDDATRASQRAARDDTLQSFLDQAGTWGEEEQRLLVYRGLEGLPLEEVAELLGLGLEAVKKRWQRLRAKLRDAKAPADLV